MIRVAHVITGLGTGGAESMLLKLIGQMDRERFSARVYVLTAITGPVADGLAALGVPIRYLGMARESPSPAAVLRLARWLRADGCDVVQTWMYHADLVGGVAAKLASPRLPVVWNIRHSNLDRRTSRGRTRRVAQLCALLSGWLPSTILCCGITARRVHAAAGYRDGKIRVVPNGFDAHVFRPDAEARAAVRDELGIPAAAPLVGLVARFDPQKDHATFLRAAAWLHARIPQAHFLLCGTGVDARNPQLAETVAQLGLAGVCHLLGERRDVARLNAALDVATSSSSTEGFPNTVGEAMASGVPCVVTDVGDSAYLVGTTGCVVPAGDAEAMGSAWLELLTQPARRCELGRMARERVEREFSIQAVARQYEDTYAEAFGA